ncbi:MAG: KpsF/GutQ family sugar-phosphate isomerase [Alphaproteobacteria bacterium]|nr:KpsF/GutQ family sugar-phosphate isomerase [Alphaproteobacteria bacterium]
MVKEALDHDAAKRAGQDVIIAEARALDALAAALAGPLGTPFAAACAAIAGASGRAIVTGMGKSGHVARKIAATLSSTGRPAQFVHPGEASHGDLGMITRDDVVLALSRSGEVTELTDIIYHCRRLRIPLIAMTFKPDSTLASASDIVLTLPDCGEASDDAPAPTTSTTMSMALGDAIAVALLKSKGFNAAHFKEIHPGGTLGAALKHVGDIMRHHVPMVSSQTGVRETLAAMTDGLIGCVAVVEKGALIGIVTDGDLRRRLTPDMFDRTAADLMTANPRVITSDASLADAIAVLNELKITVLFVVENGAPIGVVHMHDLLSAGVR